LFINMVPHHNLISLRSELESRAMELAITRCLTRREHQFDACRDRAYRASEERNIYILRQFPASRDWSRMRDALQVVKRIAPTA
jgi:hypothetical protein